MEKDMKFNKDNHKFDDKVQEIRVEYTKACENFGEFVSRHEGIAIIEEEFLEFREAAMWPHKCESNDAYTEVKQLAAMCIRYMVDVERT